MIIAFLNRKGECLSLAVVVYLAPDLVLLDAIIVKEELRLKGIGLALLTTIKSTFDIEAFATKNSLVWYEKNGFRALDKQSDGTTKITTGESNSNHEKFIPVIDNLNKDDISKIEALTKKWS